MGSFVDELSVCPEWEDWDSASDGPLALLSSFITMRVALSASSPSRVSRLMTSLRKTSAMTSGGTMMSVILRNSRRMQFRTSASLTRTAATKNLLVALCFSVNSVTAPLRECCTHPSFFGGSLSLFLKQLSYVEFRDSDRNV